MKNRKNLKLLQEVEVNGVTGDIQYIGQDVLIIRGNNFIEHTFFYKDISTIKVNEVEKQKLL